MHGARGQAGVSLTIWFCFSRARFALATRKGVEKVYSGKEMESAFLGLTGPGPGNYPISSSYGQQVKFI